MRRRGRDSRKPQNIFRKFFAGQGMSQMSGFRAGAEQIMRGVPRERPRDPREVGGGGDRARRRRQSDYQDSAAGRGGGARGRGGEGEGGEGGGEAGDLYVRVRVEPHREFKREGDDLLMKVAAPLMDVLLSREIEVKTISGQKTKTQKSP